VAGIDLNADLGEGFGVWRLGEDDAMLGTVTSAKVAYGFHAGDPAGLLQVCRAAAGAVTSGQVTAIDGTQIAVSVESVCVHGDSPGAVQIAPAVRDQLKAAGIDIRAFCSCD
jgi:lactam utilization protein B